MAAEGMTSAEERERIVNAVDRSILNHVACRAATVGADAAEAALDAVLDNIDALAALLDPAEMLAAWERAGRGGAPGPDPTGGGGDMSTCPIIVCSMGGDHLFESCPHFQREAARFGENARSCTCEGRACNPLAETVCGWCRRVWKARYPKEEKR